MNHEDALRAYGRVLPLLMAEELVAQSDKAKGASFDYHIQSAVNEQLSILLSFKEQKMLQCSDLNKDLVTGKPADNFEIPKGGGRIVSLRVLPTLKVYLRDYGTYESLVAPGEPVLKKQEEAMKELLKRYNSELGKSTVTILRENVPKGVNPFLAALAIGNEYLLKVTDMKSPLPLVNAIIEVQLSETLGRIETSRFTYDYDTGALTLKKENGRRVIIKRHSVTDQLLRAIHKSTTSLQDEQLSEHAGSKREARSLIYDAREQLNLKPDSASDIFERRGASWCLVS
jgi:frataxin-like iron-binding protein CyaY